VTLFLSASGQSVAHPASSGVFSQVGVLDNITELPILGIRADGEVFFKRLMKGVDFQDLVTGEVENNLGNIDLARQAALSTGYQAFLGGDYTGATSSFQQVADSGTADPVLRAFAHVMLGFCEMYSSGDGAAAKAHFDNALTHFQLASAYVGRGGAQLADGGADGQSATLQNAEADFEQTLMIDPGFSFMKGFIQRNDVRACSALAMFLRGDLTGAEALAEEILAENVNLRGDSEDLLEDLLLHISLGG
jgi:hypothetical protein